RLRRRLWPGRARGSYQITQAAAGSAAPAAPARAIVWLTLFGAFSSPIYLPLTAWLVASAGWRNAIRIQAGTVLAAFVLAAILVKSPGGIRPGQPADRAAGVFRDAWRSPPGARVARLGPDRRGSGQRP